MRSAHKVTNIAEHDHFYDYAEFWMPRVEPRPRMRMNMAMVGAVIFGASVWVGVAWLFIWLATDGHRLFNHFIDRIVGAF